MRVLARASGRVNLIGDHTDYMGGLVLPMAIDLATTLEATLDEDGGPSLSLRSDAEADPVQLVLPVDDPSSVSPAWGRYVAAVAHELGSWRGFAGNLSSTIPLGAGLSSSAALEVASALALLAAARPTDRSPRLPGGLASLRGRPGAPERDQRRDLALLCQRAEHAAVGVPSGVMDQLCICAARAGTATLIDCSELSVRHVPVPEAASVWVVHSGTSRSLADSPYADRRRAAEAAESLLGPLPRATPASIESLGDPELRRAARHVRSECERVVHFAEALQAGDLVAAGQLMVSSHASLRDDYAVSTPALDQLAAALVALPGVHGARLTGAGFGGCVVALADAGVDLSDPGVFGPVGPAESSRIWRVRPSEGIEVKLSA